MSRLRLEYLDDNGQNSAIRLKRDRPDAVVWAFDRIREMGSPHLFIVFYCYLEKYFACEDYRNRSDLLDKQLQVSSR